jgi:hypothetical protein
LFDLSDLSYEEVEEEETTLVELRAIYSEYCPKKTLADVDVILAKFSGREVELLAKVKAKYCEKPEPEVITRAAQLRALNDEHHSDDSDDGYFDGTASPQRFINTLQRPILQRPIVG